MAFQKKEWVGPGNPFSQTPYREFLKLMETLHIIKKKGAADNSPWILTETGKRTLPYWAERAKIGVRHTLTHSHAHNYERFEHIEE